MTVEDTLYPGGGPYSTTILMKFCLRGGCKILYNNLHVRFHLPCKPVLA